VPVTVRQIRGFRVAAFTSESRTVADNDEKELLRIG
jgi:hypothetical protein